MFVVIAGSFLLDDEKYALEIVPESNYNEKSTKCINLRENKLSITVHKQKMLD